MVVQEKVAGSIKCALEDLDYITHQYPDAQIRITRVKTQILEIAEDLGLEAWL